MTLPGRDTAPTDRLTQGVAYGRIVIGVALALFPFGWAGSTPAQYAIILALAGAVVGIGVLQLLRPQMACVPRLASRSLRWV